MKKLLFFIVLLSSNQMFTAEGDDSGRRPALPADEPAAKRPRNDNAVTGAAAGIPPLIQPYPMMPPYHPGMYPGVAGMPTYYHPGFYSSTAAAIPFPVQQHQPMSLYHPGMYLGVAGYQQGYQPPAPAVASTPAPAVASTPAPVVASTPAPVVASKPAKYYCVEKDGKKEYVCTVCNSKYTRQDSVATHFKKKHTSDFQLYRCDICKKFFNDKGNFRQHCNSLKHKDREKASELMPLEAAALELSELDDRGETASFIYLQREGSDGNLYKCTHPGCAGRIIRFSSSDSAKRHEQGHKALDEKKFPCERGCPDKFFPRNGEREIHYKVTHFIKGQTVDDSLREETAPEPVKLVAGRKNPIKMAQNQEAYKKWITHDKDGVLTCGHPNCSQEKFKLISSLHRHIRGHVARDNGDYPCERGCVNKFFKRGSNREEHYRNVHGDVQSELRGKTAAKRVSTESPAAASFDDPEAVEDMQPEELDQCYQCIYPFCSQHNELFSAEDMVNHCQEEHGIEDEDIELDDFKI